MIVENAPGNFQHRCGIIRRPGLVLERSRQGNSWLSINPQTIHLTPLSLPDPRGGSPPTFPPLLYCSFCSSLEPRRYSMGDFPFHRLNTLLKEEADS